MMGDTVRPVSISHHSLAFWRLAGERERLDQLTFPAHGHPGESSIPHSFGHLGLAVEPLCQQLQLGRENPAVLNAFDQVLKQRRRNVMTADSRHG